jgi:hypothetical protein
MFQRVPDVELLNRLLPFMGEQSEYRDNASPNYKEFKTTHVFEDKEYMDANEWNKCTRKQIRRIQVQGKDVFVALAAVVRGELTDAKALSYYNQMTNGTFRDYNEYTLLLHNVFILEVDMTRAENYNCTCTVNTRDFTCRHSLGLAVTLRILVPPNIAALQLIGRRRRPGRQALVPPAWEYLRLDVDSPVHHVPQDHNILMGVAQAPENLENAMNA